MPLATTLSECQNKGKDMALYYNTGTCLLPVWVEHIGIQGDLNLGETDEEEEVQRRRSTTNVKVYVPGLTDVNITGNLIPDKNYEGNAYVNAARSGGNPQDFLIMTDDIGTVGAFGWRGKFYNFDRSISGPYQGEQEQTFNLKPAACSDCDVRPVKVAVAAAIIDYDATAVA